MKRVPLLLACFSLAWPAVAEQPAECLVAQHQVEQLMPLPRVSAALAAKKLDVLVVGAGSSNLPGPNGARALDQGINIAHSAGADVILVNAQYSPRTESIIALSIYADIVRWVALQHNIPLFDRFEIMKVWADLGTFDLTGAANKLDIAIRVHNCIGWLLADLVNEAVKQGGPQVEGAKPGGGN